MKMLLGLSVVASVGLWVPAMAQERDFRPPSATEVFNLRSKCAELGEKILKQSGYLYDVLSHYDVRTNRCYVELTEHSLKENIYDRYLYDGQTEEILAHAARV
jgi:hypothetical protein